MWLSIDVFVSLLRPAKRAQNGLTPSSNKQLQQHTGRHRFLGPSWTGDWSQDVEDVSPHTGRSYFVLSIIAHDWPALRGWTCLIRQAFFAETITNRENGQKRQLQRWRSLRSRLGGQKVHTKCGAGRVGAIRPREPE